MYKHILVPTDGSGLAAKGVREGIKLAKALSARVTAVYVAPPYIPPVYTEGAIYFAGGLSRDEYKKAAAKAGKNFLGVAQRLARAAGVRCRTKLVMEE